ncbi:MAG: hypothetical protein H6617_11760 [Bdellovibrionaceae bacterium]|nr:hypothetical protein [Bdellovibrionales bacterium]MCB9255348.1 hypothetical protein [Pseudobdellovibrionaceae bacterium]
MRKFFVGFISVGLLFSNLALAGDPDHAQHYGKKKDYSLLSDFKNGANHKAETAHRSLASGDAEADIEHYLGMKRRFGVDLGGWLPFGDFNNVGTLSPMLGVHFTWEAIAPLGFTLSYRHATSDNKTTPGSSKLSVNQIALGTQASFPMDRFIPFVKVEGALYFNDYHQNGATQTGDSTMLTTLGISAGLGFDFIVGREVSVGLDAMYHYPLPKNVTVAGSNFNLGSPFATFAFRLNF